MTDTPSAGTPVGHERSRLVDPPWPTIAYIPEPMDGVPVLALSVLEDGLRTWDRSRRRFGELIRKHAHREPSAGGDQGDIVEILFPELVHMWGAEILRGVERVARENRVGVVFSELGFDRATAVYLDGSGGQRGQDVLSITFLREGQRERLRAQGIPFVVFDPAEELAEDVPFVSATQWKGARAAVGHLADLGHRRIGMISGPDHSFCVARVAGYTSALQEAGLGREPDLFLRTELTREDGYAAARELLSRPDRPTAVFTASDMQAIGLYQAARELGLSIPRDLSVASFDDLPVAAWMDPPLTTVRQPLTAMARAAAELALALGSGEDVPQTRLDIATSLVVRDSTAPPAF
ncbi:substrate-binding domain-containing protein [Streptomyces sp. ME18-1-4]|uniref:substrate-binding domain-containing protein n=1 Tax=Streptomyces sp. ME18-1-4 TaxID=3028685 RepID=UPI0029BC390B|nr:substrate-binding domain-containing protein [Streptomyces sp. ME18-1-4]MDX3241277.1 substrate-binding domain-containing protein [Streptomyces sp. ME18-1-4]